MAQIADKPVVDPIKPIGNDNIDATHELDFSFLEESTPDIPAADTDNQDNTFSFLGELSSPEQPVSPQPATDTIFSFDEEFPSVGTDAEQATEMQPDGDHIPDSSLLPTEPQSMKFTCRKCSTPVEVEFAENFDGNLKITCSSCFSKSNIIRESNANRAAQKSSEIYCCKCSHLLAHYVHCPSCGLFCPDYFVMENPGDAKRRSREQRTENFWQSLANLKSSLTWTPDNSKSKKYETQRTLTSTAATSEPKSSFVGKFIKPLVAIAVLVAVIGIAAFYYLQQKAELQYAKNYIKVIYILHSGSEGIITSLTKMSADWKTAAESGRTYTPGTNIDLEVKSARIITETTKLMQQMQKVPKKYELAHSKLVALNSEYNALIAVAAVQPSSLDQLNKQTEKSDTAIKQKFQEVKASISGDLVTELEVAKKKYRGFATF